MMEDENTFNLTLCIARQLIQTRVSEDPNASDLIAGICKFHSFLVEVQTNAGYIYAMHV